MMHITWCLLILIMKQKTTEPQKIKPQTETWEHKQLYYLYKRHTVISI